MDECCGICPECGGWLIYIYSLNMIICDTCEYEQETVL